MADGDFLSLSVSLVPCLCFGFTFFFFSIRIVANSRHRKYNRKTKIIYTQIKLQATKKWREKPLASEYFIGIAACFWFQFINSLGNFQSGGLVFVSVTSAAFLWNLRNSTANKTEWYNLVAFHVIWGFQFFRASKVLLLALFQRLCYSADFSDGWISVVASFTYFHLFYCFSSWCCRPRTGMHFKWSSSI